MPDTYGGFEAKRSINELAWTKSEFANAAPLSRYIYEIRGLRGKGTVSFQQKQVWVDNTASNKKSARTAHVNLPELGKTRTAPRLDQRTPIGNALLSTTQQHTPANPSPTHYTNALHTPQSRAEHSGTHCTKAYPSALLPCTALNRTTLRCNLGCPDKRG